MYKNFNLTESEREQILNQHKGYGYKKPLNEQEISGTTNKESGPNLGQIKRNESWSTILKTLGSTTKRHIKMRDGEYSLNWGSHSGPGYDWGMSVAKRGSFHFQTDNKEKKSLMESLISKYSIPFNQGEYQGRYSVHLVGSSQTIYSIPTDKLISFLKEILSKMSEKSKLNEQSVEDEKEELSFHMKNGVIANLLEKRGYKKVKESTNDGNVINIYDYVDGSYTIRVEIFTTKDKILGIVLYRGPEFGYPNTKVEENLIEKIFKREFISLNKGLGNFQDVLDKAKDILESTKKYNNAPSLPKSKMYEGDINEGFGRDISVQMAIWSHLSDIEYDSPEQRKIRCNFIKLLVAKYIPKDVEVNEDKLDALYDQVSNRDFSGSALDEPAMDDMNEGWRDIFGEPDVKDAARSAYKSQGHSMMGSDDEQRKGEHYTVFNGEKFFSNQIEYADYQDMGELPRIENGMLIVPNPAWES